MINLAIGDDNKTLLQAAHYLSSICIDSKYKC